jgi:xylulokinase
VLGPTGVAGHLPNGAPLGPGAGDNAAAGLGAGALPGDVVVSIGTSGTVFVSSDVAPNDPSGTVAGFADCTGRYLPIVVTLNAARVLDAATRLLGVGHDELSRLALSAPAGADGLVLIPYLEGERTPNRPNATGAIHGLTLRTADPAHLARAAVEGMLCALADGLDALVEHGAAANRIVLVGGGARSEAVRRIAPALFGKPVLVPPPGEYVADGAARQAAWVIAGGDTPPTWSAESPETYEDTSVPLIREQYAAARDAVIDRAAG